MPIPIKIYLCPEKYLPLLKTDQDFSANYSLKVYQGKALPEKRAARFARRVMRENISAASFDETLSGAGAKAFRTIVCGGSAVGVLDGIAASLNAIFAGRSPAVVWQYVASGLLGSDSYNYGWKTVVLGLVIHFFIAFSVTTIYYAASRRLPIIVRRAVPFGALYGAAVYFVMVLVVTPLSAAAKLPFSILSMLVGLLIHVFCVGLPIILITRRFAKNG